MSEKRPVDEAALEEASRTLWGGEAEPVSGETLAEAVEAMFGTAPTKVASDEDLEEGRQKLFG